MDPMARRVMELVGGDCPCSTYAAYMRHLRHGEPTCQPCRDARAEYVRTHPPARRKGAE